VIRSWAWKLLWWTSRKLKKQCRWLNLHCKTAKMHIAHVSFKHKHIFPIEKLFFVTNALTLLIVVKDIMQGKFFQRCTHLFYCRVLALGGNVNTRRESKPDMGSIFHTKNKWNILVRRNYYVHNQNYQNLMLLTSSDTKRTLMHLFLFTNSAQRELVSICTLIES